MAMSMYSLNSQDPCADSEHLLRIFPAELWQNILGNITDSKDQENCYNSSSFFHDYFHTKRTSFFFPGVFRAMEKTVYRNLSRAHMYTLSNPADGGPSAGSSSQNAETVDKGAAKVLKLRRVCESWKNGVDKFYQSRLTYGEPRDVAYGGAFDTCFQPKQFAFNDEGLTLLFLQLFGDARQSGYAPSLVEKYCPLLSRTVSVEYNLFPGSSFQRFHQNLKTIFVNYGHLLNKFSMNYEIESFLLDAHRNFRHYLTLMKNLKTLEIRVYRYFGESDKGLFSRYSIDMKLNPCFTLEKLEFLSIRNVPNLFFDHFIRLNSHITRLRVSKSQGFGCYDFSAIFLPNLTHLEIWLSSEEELEILKLANFSEKFEKLELYCYKVIEPRKIFPLLGSKWANTLAQLLLNFKCPTVNSRVEREITKVYRRECTKLQKKFLPCVTDLKIRKF